MRNINIRILWKETDKAQLSGVSCLPTQSLHQLTEYQADDECVFVDHQSDSDEDVMTTDEQERLKVEEKLQTSSDSTAPIPRPESIDARLCYVVKQNDTVVDEILRKMWQYIQTYTVRFKPEVDEEGMPVWYIMDEFGVRISHSDTPNVRVVPLYFIPHNAAYSVIFLTKEVADGGVTSDIPGTLEKTRSKLSNET
ncbi:hypothetical protein OSTOST_19415 [Ostertagia ostertagi]